MQHFLWSVTVVVILTWQTQSLAMEQQSPEIKITNPSTLISFKPTWYISGTYNITWRSVNTERNVSIYLVDNTFDRINNKPNFQIVYEIARNIDVNGFHVWRIHANVPILIDASIQIIARAKKYYLSHRMVKGQSSKIDIDKPYGNIRIYGIKRIKVDGGESSHELPATVELKRGDSIEMHWNVTLLKTVLLHC